MIRPAFRSIVILALSLAVALPAGALRAAEGEQSGEDWKALKQESKRQKIDAVADETLETLFEHSDKARELFDKSHGWAVFDNLKLAFFFSGGGGAGVAVERASGQRIYMKMGTAGIGFSLGAQIYDVVFLFEDEGAFQHFLEVGWEGETQANLAAGTMGANASTSFIKGKAVYQLTQSGVMASADIAGSKYWVSKRLN